MAIRVFGATVITLSFIWEWYNCSIAKNNYAIKYSTFKLFTYFFRPLKHRGPLRLIFYMLIYS